MMTKEEVLEEIKSAMVLNKDSKARCNDALTHAMSLIMHETKELQNIMDEVYKRGMNDAWETVRELCKIEYDDYVAIFGEYNVEAAVNNFTPFEIKEKYASYMKEKEKKKNENKIVVGSVIRDINNGLKATVLKIDTDGSYCVFTQEGNIDFWFSHRIEKTDKYVNVHDVLFK